MKHRLLYAISFALLGCTSAQQTPSQDITIVVVAPEKEGSTRLTYQAFNRLYTVYVEEASCHYQTGKSTLISSKDGEPQVQPNDHCEKNTRK